MSDREWTLVGSLGLLLIVVVGVGTLQGTIDATAVALALIAAISGTVTGLIAKGSFGTGSKKKHAENDRSSTP